MVDRLSIAVPSKFLPEYENGVTSKASKVSETLERSAWRQTIFSRLLSAGCCCLVYYK